MIVYSLSSRQAKELRRNALQLAISAAPYVAFTAARDYARERLPDVADSIRDAWTDIIRVRPCPSTPGLTGMLGDILTDDTPSGLCLWVHVVIVDLARPGALRARTATQWPGAARDTETGFTWPRQEPPQ